MGMPKTFIGRAWVDGKPGRTEDIFKIENPEGKVDLLEASVEGLNRHYGELPGSPRFRLAGINVELRWFDDANTRWDPPIMEYTAGTDEIELVFEDSRFFGRSAVKHQFIEVTVDIYGHRDD